METVQIKQAVNRPEQLYSSGLCRHYGRNEETLLCLLHSDREGLQELSVSQLVHVEMTLLPPAYQLVLSVFY